MKKRILFASCALLGGAAQAQLTIDDQLTPQQLVQDVLLGAGVTVSNISFNGVLNPVGVQPGSASFTATNSNLGLSAGVLLTSGVTQGVAGPASFFARGTTSTGRDPDLVTLANPNTHDRAVLEFDCVPQGDSVKFRYVFGSEEYPEYVCTNFNDAFGFFLSGPGINGTFTNGAVNIARV
ncbi:MAG: choice-of-anchor L domain-containing protein, partial [Flavobacteriales bacterium]